MSNIKTIVIPCEGDIVKFKGDPADTGTVMAVTASDMVLVRWHNTSGDTAVPHDALELVTKLPRIPSIARCSGDVGEAVNYEYRACFAAGAYTLVRFADLEDDFSVEAYYYRASYEGLRVPFSEALGNESFTGCRAALVEINKLCGNNIPTKDQWDSACEKGIEVARQQERDEWYEEEGI